MEAVIPLLQPGVRVASFGYPDIITPLELLEQDLGDKFPKLQYREDSRKICLRHSIKERQIPDAHSFFELMGAKLDVYDIVQERGCEIICDLNEQQNWSEPYDVVLDVGTAEHCFNIAQAIMNMASLVKSGGFILHENPFNWGNHGFYNLNPTWYADFYNANGFKILECLLMTRDGRGCAVSHTKRFTFVAEECNVFVSAQRVDAEQRSYVMPTQTKYAKSIPAAGVRADSKEIAHVNVDGRYSER